MKMMGSVRAREWWSSELARAEKKQEQRHCKRLRIRHLKCRPLLPRSEMRRVADRTWEASKAAVGE